MLQNLLRSNIPRVSKQISNRSSLKCTDCLRTGSNLDHIYKANVSLPSTMVLTVRNYSIGDYDKLLQAVTSGRGGSRGRPVIKKADPEEEKEYLKFGSKMDTLNPVHQEYLKIEKNNTLPGFVRFKNQQRIRFPQSRGWSGRSWPGRDAGPPEQHGEVLDDFRSIVLEVRRVNATLASGRHWQFSAMVAVGNGNGAVGWAIGKALKQPAAIAKARNKAVNYLHHIPMTEERTLYHDLDVKVRNTHIFFQRKVPGYGRRCQRIIRAITELAGIENIRCKIVGRSTPLTVIVATFKGLQMQETHEELSERTGKYVVEYRPEEGNRPIVVATPSLNAIKQRIKEESEVHEVDITKYFDPYRNAHTPKKPDDATGSHTAILADI